MKRNRRKMSFLGFVARWGLMVFICLLLTIIYLAESKLERLVPGGWGESFSTKILSYPFLIKNESKIDYHELTTRLHRLNYQTGAMDKLLPGEYAWSDPILTISLRGFTAPHMNQEKIQVKLIRWQGNQWHLKDSQDRTLSQIMLEPELAAELSGPMKVRREPATWEEFPPHLINAVVAIEDRRFFSHHGVDLRSIGRAAWNNLKNRKKIQGGSTITQQLSKNLFLTHQRTISRKIIEAFLALYLDLRFSKEKILTLYLNHIYLGQDGFFSVAGIKAASQFYFGKNPIDLDLAESALLAGLIRSPYKYNPFQNPIAALNRRNTVLKIMNDLGTVDKNELSKTAKAPIKIVKQKPAKSQTNENDYFVSEVVRRMLPRYSEDMVFRYGLKIYTTLDPLWQKKAHDAVQKTKYQAALVALTPATGRIACIVGGKNYQESQFNRATQALRQPGSSFKPFVYAAGLKNGFTPASLLNDKPRAYADPGTKKIWAPQNFDGKFRGEVTFRQALAQSINGATLDLAEKIGIHQIIYFAKEMGIYSHLNKDLPTALGSSEISPLELTAAYSPFANGGFHIEPTLICSVQDLEGNVLELAVIERKFVIEPALAYLMTSMLESSIKEGTAKSLSDLGWNYHSAGKTGTTNQGKDAWFIGYTSDLLTGVWVGNDDATAANLSGAKDAVPIWATFMKSIYGSIPTDDFVQPQGLETARIDPVSGFLARSGCTIRKDELFLKGTSPTQYCSVHAGGIRGWLQKIFSSKTAKTAGNKNSGNNDE